MKQTIIDITKTLFDAIFSFFTFLFLAFGFIIWMCVVSAENTAKEKEQLRIATEACYNQGMVLVNTDAGQRCTAPQSLVKVK